MRVALSVLAILILASCASPRISERLTLLTLAQVEISASSARVALLLRNPDLEEPLAITVLECLVFLDGIEISCPNFNGDVLPGNAERLTTEQSIDARTANMLLDANEPLPYAISGFVEGPRFGQISVAREGVLFPTPGKPGTYR